MSEKIVIVMKTGIKGKYSKVMSDVIVIVVVKIIGVQGVGTSQTIPGGYSWRTTISRYPRRRGGDMPFCPK